MTTELVDMRIRWKRVRRWLVIGIVACLLVPVVLVLPLNFIQPPTTSVMLQRAVQRMAAGKHPYYPRRVVVRREAIAPSLRRAVLAAEDDRFYLHHGFDFEEISRAIAASRHGERLRGASTISQQTAKNLFLWEGRSFVRKGIEAYLTVVLEFCLSKDRILDIYLNLAEWGDGVFGAEMAAEAHYHKHARDLSRDEAARLAAILPAPRRWSPNGGIARERASVILERMQYPAPRPTPSRR